MYIGKLSYKVKVFILVVAVLLTACKVRIQEDLSEEQANKIIVVLSQNDIEAEKRRRGNDRDKRYEVWVSKALADKAWRVMKENDLPLVNKDGIAEVYGKGNLVPSIMEEKALYLRALQGELAKTLNSIEGVINARVHIVIPDDIFLNEDNDRALPKAAVFIKYHLREDGSVPFKENEIKALIAGAVKGLEERNVQLILQQIYSTKITQQQAFKRYGLIKVSEDTAEKFNVLMLLILLLIIILVVFIFLQLGENYKLRREIYLLTEKKKKSNLSSMNENLIFNNSVIDKGGNYGG